VKRDSDGSWTLISNHGAALVHLGSEPESTLLRLSSALGVTERTAVRIVQELRAEGYVVSRRMGRRNMYSVDIERRLRDPVLAHRTVGDFLDGLVTRDGAGEQEATNPPGVGARSVHEADAATRRRHSSEQLPLDLAQR
jgi:DNA-binding transcriptional ArsR family regulator